LRLVFFILIFILTRFSKQPLTSEGNWEKVNINIPKNRTSINEGYVLGINSYYHDSSATIIQNGKILWAAQEERFTRLKNDSSFPRKSIQKGLEYLKIKPSEISLVSYFEDPSLKRQRIFNQINNLHLKDRIFFIWSNAFRLILQTYLFYIILRLDLIKCGIFKPTLLRGKIIYSNHHLSHAASAFLPSPFGESAIICIDAVGEKVSTSIFRGEGRVIEMIEHIDYPHSIGMVFSAFTAYCGFKVNSGEYKLMGLAPFGNDVYKDRILKDILTLRSDGSYKVNSEYLPFAINTPILNSNFISYWGRKPRDPNDESGIDKFYCDIAASIQSVLNEYILLIAKRAKLKTKSENLCLAGGVALNCVSNSILVRSNIFKNIWIQPAAGDAGTSLGAALLCSSMDTNMHSYQKDIYQSDAMNGSFLGSDYSNAEILKTLKNFGLSFLFLSRQEINELAVKAIQENKIIGYFNGRMEFGPRALGSRSILANPKDPNGQSRINKAIKFRESFRPFAPAMLPEVAFKYFNIEKLDPYMLFTWFLKDEYRLGMSRKFDLSDVNLLRSKYPSITHMDYSARVQVVEKSSPLFNLLQLGLSKSNLEMVVNTSFNVRGEPIVESPINAIECFLSTAMDYLAIGNYWVDKSKQLILETPKRKTYPD